MTASSATIVTESLGREFAGKWAVRGLDLCVQPGEIYGFLGQNGAGKTTTIRMLSGLLRPSEGSLRIAGLDHTSGGRALKQIIGLVPDTPPVYDYLTGRQYVALVASLWHIARRERDERCARLFHLLALDEAADDLCKGYSHGMRKKVHLAAVLTTAPQVLLLDEPTTGLDPITSTVIENLIVGLTHDTGATSIVVTHQHSTIFRGDTITMLYQGQVVGTGTPDEMRAIQTPLIRNFLDGIVTDELKGD